MIKCSTSIYKLLCLRFVFVYVLLLHFVCIKCVWFITWSLNYKYQYFPTTSVHVIQRRHFSLIDTMRNNAMYATCSLEFHEMKLNQLRMLSNLNWKSLKRNKFWEVVYGIEITHEAFYCILFNPSTKHILRKILCDPLKICFDEFMAFSNRMFENLNAFLECRLCRIIL